MARKGKKGPKPLDNSFRIHVTDLYPEGMPQGNDDKYLTTKTKYVLTVWRGPAATTIQPGFKSKARAERFRDAIYPILKREWDRENGERQAYYDGLESG